MTSSRRCGGLIHKNSGPEGRNGGCSYGLNGRHGGVGQVDEHDGQKKALGGKQRTWASRGAVEKKMKEVV